MTNPKRPPQSICVYSSSSDTVDPAYFELATALGAAIGRRGDRLVFGGSNTGLMGVVAQAVKDHGGEVVAVIPEIMRGTPYVFDRADELVTDRFQGIFERLRPRFAPLLAEARGTLSRLPVRPELHPYYSYGVLEHAQPSFMLLPLMFLSLADHVRGVGPRHLRHLPWLMLAMEACAILDDTVDHTSYRSGRLSYPGRFGAASAAPFSTLLVTVVMERTSREEPELVPIIADLFQGSPAASRGSLSVTRRRASMCHSRLAPCRR